MSENKPPRVPKLPKPPNRRNSPNNDGEQPPNFRFFALLLVGAFLIFVLYWAWKIKANGTTTDIDTDVFFQYLKEKKIENVEVVADSSLTNNTVYVTGKFKPEADVKPGPGNIRPSNYRTQVNLLVYKDFAQDMASYGFTNLKTSNADNTVWQILGGILPFLLIILLFYFLFSRQMRMAGKSAMSFGRSKARMLSKDKNRITFKDVAGVDEAKEEVREIVEFLKDPKKFQRLGGRIPKGILMVGPPGTGKTLLAKAIAGEADVPFYGISGSDFVEMFVGVGASRVRDMFEQGRKSAPCLIFIDEIDAVGRSRGHGLGGGHDEREQTLNALLVEMDGIDTQEGVIIIAATNRKDVLDPALLRPGRFDREVTVNLPDVKGREQILAVHSKKVKASPAVDWNKIARGTPGFSGAELANLINEAALLAARRSADAIEQPDLEEARDKVRWGRERRSMAMSEKQKRITAYHEAGHALLNVLLEHTDPLHKVSIIPRGPALGVTMMLPEEDKLNLEYKHLIDDLCVTMGGRVAEELFMDDFGTGAAGDIRMATHYARSMVCRWGMSDKLGMIEYGQQEDYVFLGRDLNRGRGYSEETAELIDNEVRKLVQGAYERAKQIIGANRDKMELIANALLEYETLDAEHVIDLIKNGKMNNPPPRQSTPPALPNPQESLDKAKAESKKGNGDGTLPGLEGAPAGA
ncbi:MAG: ATP-dependent zinc metalloprotease FtsH [Verrucomicrobiales bacterium]|jgi:cell division protease FtsH|nr:ATP-dependent zinc metalloprotease FtsH [Verrucomicrobiales bacterium]